MPFYTELTGAKPLFAHYSLDAVCSNSNISHVRASRELGFQPHPARQAISDAVSWFRERQVYAVPAPNPIAKAAA